MMRHGLPMALWSRCTTIRWPLRAMGDSQMRDVCDHPDVRSWKGSRTAKRGRAVLMLLASLIDLSGQGFIGHEKVKIKTAGEGRC